MGLNESYASIHSQILAVDPLTNIGKVYSIIHQEEKQRLLHLPTLNSDSVVMAANRNFSHSRPNEPRGIGRGRPKCDHCGTLGHWKDTCYKLVGYPPNWDHSRSNQKFSQNKGSSPYVAHHVSTNPGTSHTNESSIPGLSAEQHRQLMDLLSPNHSTNLAGNVLSHSCNLIPDLHSSDWVMDSGASDHMTSLPSILETSHEVQNASPIKLPTGELVPITHIGSIKLSPTVTKANVLYVPDFKFNLLSISKITRALNCVAIFFSTFCVFQDLATRKLIGMGELRDGLYYYKATAPPHFPATPSAMHSNKTLTSLCGTNVLGIHLHPA